MTSHNKVLCLRLERDVGSDRDSSHISPLGLKHVTSAVSLTDPFWRACSREMAMDLRYAAGGSLTDGSYASGKLVEVREVETCWTIGRANGKEQEKAVVHAEERPHPQTRQVRALLVSSDSSTFSQPHLIAITGM